MRGKEGISAVPEARTNKLDFAFFGSVISCTATRFIVVVVIRFVLHPKHGGSLGDTLDGSVAWFVLGIGGICTTVFMLLECWHERYDNRRNGRVLWHYFGKIIIFYMFLNRKITFVSNSKEQQIHYLFFTRFVTKIEGI